MKLTYYIIYLILYITYFIFITMELVKGKAIQTQSISNNSKQQEKGLKNQNIKKIDNTKKFKPEIVPQLTKSNYISVVQPSLKYIKKKKLIYSLKPLCEQLNSESLNKKESKIATKHSTINTTNSNTNTTCSKPITPVSFTSNKEKISIRSKLNQPKTTKSNNEYKAFFNSFEISKDATSFDEVGNSFDYFKSFYSSIILEKMNEKNEKVFKKEKTLIKSLKMNKVNTFKKI